VEPEVTVIGPLIVMVGLVVPELWHIVHVEPLLPDTPEIPFGYANADLEKQITENTISAATERGSFRCIILLLDRLGAGGLLSCCWLHYLPAS
jgi:hypothetical protein